MEVQDMEQIPSMDMVIGQLVRTYDMTHKEAVKLVREAITAAARELKAYMGEEAFNLCRTSNKCPSCRKAGA
jgi:20S proteasome alpha/beta subunit|tara:strand:- start:521 stop:736 length:216 start_codon:yes stop_codon:yes gene_type:complete